MDPQVALPGQEASSCPGTGPVDLTQMDASQRGKVLVARTVRFAGTFLRWMDSRACGSLTYPRLRLLEALHLGGPAKMADLATQLGISARNMTALVDALEAAQLVVRRPHPSDRRAILIELTAGGIGAAETSLGPGLDAMARLFDRMPVPDQQQYLTAIGQLLEVMDSPPEPAVSPAEQGPGTAGPGG
jgi:DNA-binding MarR family transcriptional regulator